VDPHTTIIVPAVGVAISGAALWLEHRPKDVRWSLLIPTTTPILIVGILITLAAIVIANLHGRALSNGLEV
jgi:hypothetical protein